MNKKVFVSCTVVIMFLLVWLGIAALTGWILMLLWNWLMPEIFGLTVITFWQAVGITALLTLIGGFFKRSDK